MSEEKNSHVNPHSDPLPGNWIYSIIYFSIFTVNSLLNVHYDWNIIYTMNYLKKIQNDHTT